MKKTLAIALQSLMTGWYVLSGVVARSVRLRGHLKSSHVADKPKNFHMGGGGGDLD